MSGALVVGAGPAGLMAAETLASAGVTVDVYDAMPSAGRKFLLAGRGGLNLTHSEPFELFAGRFGARRSQVEPWLRQFDPAGLRRWAAELGVDTFVGSSGRVFPAEMKAAPLLRAWLQRLRAAGVRFHMRHHWRGWSGSGAPTFDTEQGVHEASADALVLALGGASWPRLGSDGSWVPLLAARGVAIEALRPANCGFDLERGWSDHFRDRYAGLPFKSVAIHFSDASGASFERQGEFVATAIAPWLRRHCWLRARPRHVCRRARPLRIYISYQTPRSALHDARELFRVGRVKKRLVDCNSAVLHVLHERLVHGRHAVVFLANLHQPVDLMQLILANERANCGRACQIFVNEHPAAPIGFLAECLAQDSFQRKRNERPNIIVKVFREQLDDAVDRLNRAVRMQR